jgi:soluble lytic murein transglycosylase-like protein
VLAAIIASAAERNAVSSRIIAGVVVIESLCRTAAISETGAVGLMQVAPKVHHLDRRRLFDPEFNVGVGSHILSYNVRRWGLQEGLQNYYGSKDSDSNRRYADIVLAIAYGRD